jgi:hypothetical protein
MKPLRQGRFKKQLVSPETLPREAAAVERAIASIPPGLPDAAYAALWCLHYLRVRHPKGWWGARQTAPVRGHAMDMALTELGVDWTGAEEKLLSQHATLGDLWAGRAFKATPLPVHRALLAWSTGDYPLVRLGHIPSVAEVLAQQTNGQRCVTLIAGKGVFGRLVLGERDPLGFAYHDLVHADHFFHDNETMRGQIGFYRLVDRMLRERLLAPFEHHAEFAGRLDYLLADMNAHPVHLWKCLRAACVTADRTADAAFFSSHLASTWQLPGHLAVALTTLNTPAFQDEQAVALTEWCAAAGN